MNTQKLSYIGSGRPAVTYPTSSNSVQYQSRGGNHRDNGGHQGGHVIAVRNNQELDNHVANNNKTVVMFSMNGCGHCKRIKPVFDKLSEEFPNIIFVLADDRIKSQHSGFPTFTAHYRGQQVHKWSGSDAGKLRAAVVGLHSS